jgi:hypothetical protein
MNSKEKWICNPFEQGVNSKYKWVYNPFEKTAGWQAFGIGIVILAITTVTGYFGHTVFYALSIKTRTYVTLETAFSVQFLGLAVWVAVTYAAALVFAKHVRFQDVLGTTTLANYPLLLMAIVSLPLGKRMASIDVIKLIHHGASFSDIAVLVVFAIFALIFTSWQIYLLFNAFKVSTNLKEYKGLEIFAFILLSSVILTGTLVVFYFK